MFERIPVELSQVKLISQSPDHERVRWAQLAFTAAFDSEFAGGLGGFAKAAHEALSKRDARRIELTHCDGQPVQVRLEACEYPHPAFEAQLKRATCTAPTGDDEDPQVKLVLTCAWDQQLLLTLAANHQRTVTLSLTRRQLELPGTSVIKRRRKADDGTTTTEVLQ